MTGKRQTPHEKVLVQWDANQDTHEERTELRRNQEFGPVVRRWP
jgi:hypothetical protein